MKKFISVMAIVCCMLVGCETWSSDNGELDGIWYLSRVDSLENYNFSPYREKRVFWSFQGTIMQAHSSSDLLTKFMCKFERKNNSLRVYSPYLYDRMNGDEYLTEDDIIRVADFGINNLDETFNIETLNNSTMVLRGNKLRLIFEKY